MKQFHQTTNLNWYDNDDNDVVNSEISTSLEAG